jgi:hypothetical protein
MTITRTDTRVIDANEAKSLLAKNVKGNRPINRGWVEFLKSELKEGRWHITNDAIVVSAFGELLNGQHRLTACVETGLPIMVAFMSGVPRESYLAMDRGRKRTVSDVTNIEPELVADITLYLNLRSGTKNRNFSPEVVRDARDQWLPIWNTLMKPGVNFGKRKGRSSAPLRVAVGLRWATERTAERRAYVLQQYTAFGISDVQNMSKATMALLRRVSDRPHDFRTATGTGRVDAMVQYWVHFDPDRRNREPGLKEREAHLRQVMEWAAALPNAYMLGPDRDGHPYLFDMRPGFNATNLSGCALSNMRRSAR